MGHHEFFPTESGNACLSNRFEDLSFQTSSTMLRTGFDKVPIYRGSVVLDSCSLAPSVALISTLRQSTVQAGSAQAGQALLGTGRGNDTLHTTDYSTIQTSITHRLEMSDIRRVDFWPFNF